MEKMINLKITEDDLFTLNNVLSCLLDSDDYSNNDIIAVLNKIRRTAIINKIELTDWTSY